MKRFDDEKGAALVLALIVMMALSLLTVSVFTQSVGKARRLDSDTGRRLAFQAAEAALDRAILNIRSSAAGLEGGGVLGSQQAPVTFGECSFWVTATDLTAAGTVPKYKKLLANARVTSGRFGGGTAEVEAVVKVARGVVNAPNPLPGVDGPLGSAGFHGDPDKAKIDVPGHIDDWDIESLFSGIDAAGGDDALAMGFSSEDSYIEVMERISEKMAAGKLPPEFFTGDPLVSYTNSNGDTVETSIGYVPESAEDAAERSAYIDGLADAVADAVMTEIVPEADLTVTTNKIDSDQVWGTAGDPQVTVIESDNLKIEDGATVTGVGTLVVLGSKIDIRDAGLVFDGDIILLGEDGDGNKSKAELKSRGTLDVDGTITLIGGDASSDKVKFEVRNDSGAEGAYTSITGAVLLLGGGGDEKDKVDFRIKHGSATIDGLILALGSQVKFDFKPAKNKHDRGGDMFEFLGAIIAGIGETAKNNSKLDMKIKGAVSVQYDSAALAQAMAELLRLAGKLGDTNPLDIEPGVTVDVVSWREIR